MITKEKYFQNMFNEIKLMALEGIDVKVLELQTVLLLDISYNLYVLGERLKK